MPLHADLTCVGCGKNFLSVRQHAKFCSQKCYLKNQKENNGWFKKNHISQNKGIQLSYDVRKKISDNHYLKWMKPTPKQLKILEEGRKLGKGPHIGQTWSQTKHREMIINQCEVMSEQGFTVIPLIYPIPDVIAIKDNKIYAVECETYGMPDYQKYENITYFNDIIWVIGKKELKR